MSATEVVFSILDVLEGNPSLAGGILTGLSALGGSSLIAMFANTLRSTSPAVRFFRIVSNALALNNRRPTEDHVREVVSVMAKSKDQPETEEEAEMTIKTVTRDLLLRKLRKELR